MRVIEDGVWRYYNCPDPMWSEKCRRCREKVAEIRAPVEECLNCWKVEAWSLGSAMQAFRSALAGAEGSDWPQGARLTTFALEQDFLIGALMQRGHKAIAKASRAPILVVRTGIPLDAYPKPGIETDYLLMLYAGSIEERDRLCRDAQQVLGTAGLPIRRGCWRFDNLLGPWETWYPPDKDYE